MFCVIFSIMRVQHKLCFTKILHHIFIPQLTKKLDNIYIYRNSLLLFCLFVNNINSEMKRTTVVTTQYQINQDSGSQPSMTCSCEILNDTSLSNVGDSECDCSECLEASLNAFNQFKSEYEMTTTHIRNNQRGRSVIQKRETKKQSRIGGGDFKNSRKNGTSQSQTKMKWGKKYDNQEQDDEHSGERERQWDGEEINDFLLMTRNRIRKYMDQKNRLKKEQLQEKEELKQKIKKNLEILKYNAELNQQSHPEAKEIHHPYKWNHSKYACQCNGKQEGAEKHNCCRKIKIKEKLDTGLNEIKENFSDNRDEILQDVKGKRIAQINKDKELLCPYDQCPNHHNRTDPKRIKKIQNFISKEAKKYSQFVKNQKKKEEEAKKVREGKLRAIDIKSKEIVQRSKKLDDNESRTSFKLSIDQFDTFSELRQENERKRKLQKDKKQVKRNIREGGGALQKAIYEELEQEDDLPRPTGNLVMKKTTKGQMPIFKGEKQYSERILHDAKISSPKKLNKKQEKIQPHKEKQDKQKKKAHLNKKKQEEQRMRIEEQIEKKRKQLVKQYSKRNTKKEPANRRLREQYEKQQTKKPKGKQTNNKQQASKDPYRKNYQHQPGKDLKQINAHGDPLLQEYLYHEGKRLKAAANMSEDDIFTQNINSLTSKNNLRL